MINISTTFIESLCIGIQLESYTVYRTAHVLIKTIIIIEKARIGVKTEYYMNMFI